MLFIYMVTIHILFLLYYASNLLLCHRYSLTTCVDFFSVINVPSRKSIAQFFRKLTSVLNNAIDKNIFLKAAALPLNVTLFNTFSVLCLCDENF